MSCHYVACFPVYLLAFSSNCAKFLHIDWTCWYIVVPVTWDIHYGYYHAIDTVRLLPRGCYDFELFLSNGLDFVYRSINPTIIVQKRQQFLALSFELGSHIPSAPDAQTLSPTCDHSTCILTGPIGPITRIQYSCRTIRID